MKKTTILTLLGLLVLFVVPQNVSAQAIVEKDADTYKFIFNETVKKNKGKKETQITWVTQCSSSMTTFSPSGNIVKTLYFQLQDDHPLMGTNKIYGIRIKLDDETYIVDERVELKSDGRMKVTAHLNGAGTRLPIGWQ